MDRSILGEEEIRPVKRQISVHLIRGDLMVTDIAERAAGIHQNGSTDNIGLQKDRWVFNAPVDMALGSKVDDSVRLFLFKERIHPLPVTDVELHKAEVRIIHHRLQCAEVAGIRQFIKADDSGIRIGFPHIKYEIASDKTGPAGDNIGHWNTPLIQVTSSVCSL